MTPVPGKSPGVLRSLRHRPFALLWGGQTLSSVGDAVTTIAVAWLVYDLTGSPAAMASVMVLFTLPQLALLLVGGVIGDRLPRRSVMLASDLLRCLTTSVVAALIATGQVQLWHLQVAAMLGGAVSAFFGPAYSSIAPELVPKDELLSASALRASSRSLAQIAGPLLGAVLVAFGGNTAAFAFDAATFLLSALCLIAIGPGLAARRPEVRTSPIGDLVEGFRAVASSTWLWFTIAIWSLIAGLTWGPIIVALPQLVHEHFDGKVGALGGLRAAAAVGIVVGSLVVGQLAMPRRRGLWLYSATALRGLALAAVGLAISLPLGLGLAVLFGLAIGVMAAIWEASLQELVPAYLLGRVTSIDLLGSFSLMPLGYAAVGLAAEALGPTPVFLTAGLAIAVLSAGGLLVPSVRRFGATKGPY